MTDGETTAQSGAAIPQADLREMERVAVELAHLAGAEITNALGATVPVRYKGEQGGEAAPTDPVSEIDQRVEVLIRARLADCFPEHDIIGEEIDERPGRTHDFAWVVDPVDGTSNFVNGFPLFAAAVGVLYRGEPVVGAIWCSTSHRLRAGIYHAHRGGALHFDRTPLEISPNPHLRRHLAGEPEYVRGHGLPWDVRVTGSAAVECAFVAARLLRVARFERPNVWDVGGGLVLVRAAGGEVRTRQDNGWVPFERFAPPGGTGADAADIGKWRQPLVLGDSEAVEILCQARA